ncbi:hypothetical protein NEFER03_1298 [Nematocida sp. LUAm3]|nr:hypothetical protein NEFER03_1298 [Nematocida sp. LUAm3]
METSIYEVEVAYEDKRKRKKVYISRKGVAIEEYVIGVEEIEEIWYDIDDGSCTIWKDKSEYQMIFSERRKIEEFIKEVDQMIGSWLHNTFSVSLLKKVLRLSLSIESLEKWLVQVNITEEILKRIGNREDEAKEILITLGKIDSIEVVEKLIGIYPEIKQLFGIEETEVLGVEKYKESKEAKDSQTLQMMKIYFFRDVLGITKNSSVDKAISFLQNKLIRNIPYDAKDRMALLDMEKSFVQLEESNLEGLKALIEELGGVEKILKRIGKIDEPEKIHILCILLRNRKKEVIAWLLKHKTTLTELFLLFNWEIKEKSKRHNENIEYLHVAISSLLTTSDIQMAFLLSDMLPSLFEAPGKPEIKELGKWRKYASVHFLSEYHLKLFVSLPSPFSPHIVCYIVTSGILVSLENRISQEKNAYQALLRRAIGRALIEKNPALKKYIEEIDLCRRVHNVILEDLNSKNNSIYGISWALAKSISEMYLL